MCKRIIFSLLAILLLQRALVAESSKLPAADLKALEEVSHFHAIGRVSELPSAIVALCAEGAGGMADPGQKWQVTDVIMDDKLPTRRLIWAMSDEHYYVVHYEAGGIEHSFHILVARLKSGEKKPSFVWRAFDGELKDYKSFLEGLHHNKLNGTIETPAH